MVQTIPIEIDAASGTLTFTGPAIRIGRGFRESDMKGLADLGLKRSEHTYTEKIDGKFAGYVAVNYETPPLVLGGRSVKLSIRFRSGMLVDISVAIVGLEWWTRKGHKENVALRNILFPTGPNFEGGRARVWLDRNMGALCDAGTHFCLEYDALETDDPRPVRSRKKPKNT